MRKQVEESTAAESVRRATRPAAERDRKGRFSGLSGFPKDILLMQ